MSQPQRKSPRLQGYDYSQAGAYIVTICTHHKQHIFGYIQSDKMNLSQFGIIADSRISMISNSYTSVTIDDYVVMPNHVHIIIFLSDTDETQPLLGNIVGGYKSGVSRVIRQESHYSKSIWQSRYHDHIIRNEQDLNRIREYVQTNPARWGADTFNE